MNQFYVKRSEYVELQVPANNLNATVYFPDLPNLRNTKTWGFSAYNISAVPKAQSGNALVPESSWKQSIVFLYFENGYFIAQPMTSFSNEDPNHYFELPVMLAGQNITWSKSYVQLLDTVTNYQGLSFVFNVYYSLK